jgi:hypothetical protein
LASTVVCTAMPGIEDSIEGRSSHCARCLRVSICFDLRAPVLQYPSDLWKEFIHSCRRIEQPEELSYIHRETPLIGHIATGTTAIANLKDWREISGRHTVRRKSDNGDAIQYVFNNMDGIEFLNRHCCTSLMMYRVEDEDFMG